MSSKVRILLLSITVLAGVLADSLLPIAQTTPKAIAKFTATTENVGAAGQAVRIELYGWSNDADRDQLTKAWVSPVQPVQPVVQTAAEAGAGGGRGARGARGARGGAASAADGSAAATPAAPTPVAAAAPVDAAANGGDAVVGRGARGARGGGGRGAGGPALPPLPPVTPSQSLAGALQKEPSVGILWTSETVGYSIRYAYRLPQPDGGERIILATDRRLGAWNSAWKPAGTIAGAASPTDDYRFSVIELRLNKLGLGEGKASLASPITVDGSTKSIALDNYTGVPVVLKGVKRTSGK